MHIAWMCLPAPATPLPLQIPTHDTSYEAEITALTSFFFFSDTAPPEISPLPLPDALRIGGPAGGGVRGCLRGAAPPPGRGPAARRGLRQGSPLPPPRQGGHPGARPPRHPPLAGPRR